MPNEKLDLELEEIKSEEPDNTGGGEPTDDAKFLEEHGIDGYDNVSDFMTAAKEKLSNKTDNNNLTVEQQNQLLSLTTIAASKGQTLQQYIASGGASNLGGEQPINLGFGSPSAVPKAEDYLAKNQFTNKIDSMVKAGQLTEADAAGYKLMAGVNDELMNPMFAKIESVMQLLLSKVSTLSEISTTNEYQMFPKELRGIVPKGQLDLMLKNGQAPDMETAAYIYLRTNRPDKLHILTNRNAPKSTGAETTSEDTNSGDNMPIRKTKNSPMESNVAKIDKSGIYDTNGQVDNARLVQLFPNVADQIKFLKESAKNLKPTR